MHFTDNILLPFEDRLLLALLHRIDVDAKNSGNQVKRIRTKAALDSAVATAKRVPVAP